MKGDYEMTKGVIIFTVIAIVFYLIVTIAEKIYCKKHNITVKEFKKQNEFQKKEFQRKNENDIVINENSYDDKAD